MSPKLISVTNRRTKQVELVNPRRMNRVAPVPAPSAQPHLAGMLGTQITFTRGDTIIVEETLAQIKRLLK